ncbi:MAG: ABC transporter permease subunit [Candidatus Brocadia sp.]|jgi:ABC-type transport system involved in multi-copper enzyme maturation permease subunit
MTILTIASHTFQGTIRKKTLHILIGLGVLIMAVLPVIPTTDEPDARLKMTLVVFFQVVMLLCIIGVILLSATSLPHEIEDRTIYGILSKPVSKLKVVAGKIVGFALLSALLLMILSLLNMTTIQRVASKLPEEYKGILKARKEFKASQFSIKGKPHHTREGIIWIEGGRTGIASWSFSDLCKKHENKSTLEIELNLKIECGRWFIDTVPLVVGIENILSGQCKTEVLSAKVDKPLLVKINPEIVQEGGAINVTVFPIHKVDYIGVRHDDVTVFSVQKGFVSNYAKAIVITFLKFLLIITIAVMGSTCLSAPVSIASALVVFLCGHILEFIRDFSLLMQHQDAHSHNLPAVLKKPNILLVYMDYLMKKPLEWLSFILPDFKRFDSLKFLLKGINIPLETVGFSLGYTAIYAGICLFISAIIFKKREFF